MVARKNDQAHLFIGIYGPKKLNHKFYEIIITKPEATVDKYSVDAITMCGDFNIELVKYCGHHAMAQVYLALIPLSYKIQDLLKHSLRTLSIKPTQIGTRTLNLNS
jgi:hypothetical protein